jgi:hypothetical protein
MVIKLEVTTVLLVRSRVVLPVEVCQQPLHQPAEIVVDLEVLVHQLEVVEVAETNNQIPSVFLKNRLPSTRSC